MWIFSTFRYASDFFRLLSSIKTGSSAVKILRRSQNVHFRTAPLQPNPFLPCLLVQRRNNQTGDPVAVRQLHRTYYQINFLYPVNPNHNEEYAADRRHSYSVICWPAGLDGKCLCASTRKIPIQPGGNFAFHTG